MAGKKKNSSNKISGKQKSVKDRNLNEPVIQDLIAGALIVDIAKRHKLDRHQVAKIYQQNKERIDLERKQLLDDRQEKINKALDDDVEQLVKLQTKATTLQLKAIEKLDKLITKKMKEGEELKPSLMIRAIEVTNKAFEAVRSATLAQQREANK